MIIAKTWKDVALKKAKIAGMFAMGKFRTIHNAKIFARTRSYISTAQKNGVSAWIALAKAFDGTCLFADH